MLANHVDVDEVTAAARSLAQFGLTWDATRLASQAALQTPDGRVSGAMLQLARDLKLDRRRRGRRGRRPAAVATARQPARRCAPSSRLSEREREVAELLLQGLPYRDIGSQLFISAKTVEHHVARIRRRLGAESRSELLSMLRAILGSRADRSTRRRNVATMPTRRLRRQAPSDSATTAAVGEAVPAIVSRTGPHRVS